MKLNIIPDVVENKRIVIVEDSVVRGTTTQSKMRAIPPRRGRRRFIFASVARRFAIPVFMALISRPARS